MQVSTRLPEQNNHNIFVGMMCVWLLSRQDQGNQTVRNNQSSAPTLAVVLSHVVPPLRFCAMLDDHVQGSRIPWIAIGQRSIEESFSQSYMDQDRSTMDRDRGKLGSPTEPYKTKRGLSFFV